MWYVAAEEVRGSQSVAPEVELEHLRDLELHNSIGTQKNLKEHRSFRNPSFTMTSFAIITSKILNKNFRYAFPWRKDCKDKRPVSDTEHSCRAKRAKDLQHYRMQASEDVEYSFANPPNSNHLMGEPILLTSNACRFTVPVRHTCR